MAETAGKAGKTYAKLTSLGFEIVLYVVLAVFAGQWVDSKVDLNGLGIAIFIFLAMGLWIYRVITTLNELDKSDKD